MNPSNLRSTWLYVREQLFAREFRPVLLTAFGFFIVVMSPNFTGWYGYFCDEFYYIACANHPAFGYVDHPPFAPLLLRFWGMIFGYSIPAIRLLPALVGAGTVLMAGIITRELGGGRFAQFLAAFTTAISPVVLIFSGFFSMNVFEESLWVGLWLAIILLLRSQRQFFWIIIGIIAGVGLENKHTMVLPLGMLAVSLLVTPDRRHFRSPYFWTGLAIAFVLFLPNMIWQWANGFPSLEFYREATRLKNVPTSPLQALLGQVLFMQPATFPVWIIGLGSLLLAKSLKPFRVLGFTTLGVLLLFLFSNSSRPDRIAGIYPLLFAAGSIAIERWSSLFAPRFIRATSVAVLALVGLFTLPYVVPILPPTALEKYIQWVGWSPQIERNKRDILPQWFADRLGWEESVKGVADAYHSLSPEEQREAVIYTSNYSYSGAIDLLGPRYGLPPAISNHNSYWLWGPGDKSGNVLVATATWRRDLEGTFTSVQPAGRIECAICPSYMVGIPVFICRGIKLPISEAWKSAKHYE